MAIRIRQIGDETIALCAAKSSQMKGDIYLDDAAHHALTIKFEKDFRSMGFLKEEILKGVKEKPELVNAKEGEEKFCECETSPSMHDVNSNFCSKCEMKIYP